MPGMAPNVFLCRALYQRKYSPKPLEVINRTGHVFAFQSADLALYHGPRLFSSQPDGATVAATQLDSRVASSLHVSNYGGGRLVAFRYVLVLSGEGHHQKRVARAVLGARSV